MSKDITRRRLVRRGVAWGAAAAGAPALLAGTASAQAWPSKPVRVIVSHPPGGLTDAFARAYAEYISQKVGQALVVENKTGASGIIAADFVAKSPPDGYTLLVTISTTLVMSQALFKSLPFDPNKDFVPISFMDAGHLPFIVHKSVPATNVKEFAAWAKNNKVSIGSYSPGSYSHVAAAELNKALGLQMEVVHYRGEGPMWQDMLAGTIHAANGSVAAATSVLQTGAGRAIAVPQTKRMKKLPDVATFLEQGVNAKAFQIRGWVGLFAPAGTPEAIVQRLSDLMVEAGKTPRLRQMLDTFGIDESATDHTTFAQILRDENPIWIDLVKQLGIDPQ
ncbi:tripartite tricarboxylate transporter substrate binding protein [Reyranella sp. CPCC 100927]|uniref:Bug family tripartite tricarboxylate transporter substrate binding protein n=1 Tax=Reyranella sp. CPCC 100927 TaxID=2599616 RepID=UPI0011B6B670|nr:tripartite tricarboxylate transporter substrate binding protein [Reyranella sp. CPCC 100927]TWT13752.1 tripartite tricarboxylate transporter substrate binding protein [Reyranella sp. CPCC 100927]